jgi:cytochrome c-type biogenesis protein CcmH
MSVRTLCICLATWLAALPAWAQTMDDIHAQHAPTREGMAPLEPALEARVHKLGKEIRCPMCQGLSVADSNSSSARAQVDKIRELVAEGKSDEEIRDFFVSRYGEWALLEPVKSGFNLVLYAAPFALLAMGLGVLFWRRSRAPAAAANTDAASAANAGATSPPADEDSPAARVLRDMDAPPPPPSQGEEAAALYARYESLLAQLREQREERHLLSKEEADKEETRLLEEAASCLRQLDKVSPGFNAPQASSPSSSASIHQRLWVAAIGGLLVGGFVVFLATQLLKQAEVSLPEMPPHPMPHPMEDAQLKAAFEYFNANPADLDGAAYLAKLFLQRGQWNDANMLVLAGSQMDPLHVPFRMYRCLLEGISHEQPEVRRARADELAKLFATYDGAYEAAYWAAALYSLLDDKPRALDMLLAFKEHAPLEELPPQLEELIAENQAAP